LAGIETIPMVGMGPWDAIDRMKYPLFASIVAIVGYMYIYVYIYRYIYISYPLLTFINHYYIHYEPLLLLTATWKIRCARSNGKQDGHGITVGFSKGASRVEWWNGGMEQTVVVI
jgi:hypothetical protein